jgi:hypothetical protein
MYLDIVWEGRWSTMTVSRATNSAKPFETPSMPAAMDTVEKKLRHGCHLVLSMCHECRS